MPVTDKKISQAAPAKFKGLLTIVLLSVLALEVSLLIGGALRAWEPAVKDLFVRWRHQLTPDPDLLVHSDIAAIGIDSSTLQKFGRFGAGAWLTRRPYVDHFNFMNKHLQPSVLAYDIVFEDPLGQYRTRVSESDKRLSAVVQQVETLRDNTGFLLHPVVLGLINRLSMEQGTSWMATTLSRMNADVVLGYYYRGGWMDRAGSSTRHWSDVDLYGDEDGDGMRIPYLTDVRLPQSDIHFANESMRLAYRWARNAKMPANEMLDYSLLGFVNCPQDPDGIVRRVPLVAGFKYRDPRSGKDEMVFAPSFSLLPFLLYQGLDLPLKPGDVEVFFGREIIIHPPSGEEKHVPVDDLGNLTLNFDAAFEDYESINFAATAPHSMESDETMAKLTAAAAPRIDGRIVVVGVTATGVDTGPTPLSPKAPLMHIHLTALNNMLTGSYIRELTGKETVFVYLLAWLILTAVCCVEKTARLGPAALVLAAAYFVAAFIFVYGSVRFLPVITPLLYMGLCSFTVMTYRFFTEEKAKRKIRGMFSTMVSDKVLEYLEQNPGSFSLRGHTADVTVLFSDVGGFTSISETLEPERLTALLNRYFTTVTECIMSNGGYLDKYVGDGVMAVWGAPFPDNDHAAKACRAALEQVRLLQKLNPELKEEFGTELTMRIGINSGAAIAGNMGSSRKFQYTVMGDTVNLAARLEPTNKDFGTGIIIGAETKQRVEEELATRILTRIVVKGKTEAVPIYELLGENSSLSDECSQVLSLHEEAMTAFLGRDWDKAEALLEDIMKIRPDDGPALFLKTQIKLFRQQPPPEGWGGEYVRTTKD